MNIVSKKMQNDKQIGTISIADEVVATIAGTAALEVKGVYCTPTTAKGAIINWINKKNLSKDVDIKIENNEIFVSISIVVNYGYKLQQVSMEVQEKIKSALEVMTGMKVSEVNVTVEGIIEENASN